MPQQDIYRSPSGRQLLLDSYRAQLAAWPGTPEQRHVPTPEGETFVVSAGPATAPPLVLLHGSGSNSAQWVARFTELIPYFRVHAVDIIGEPGLSAPSRPDPGTDRYAVWLDAVLDQLGLTEVAIMGYSLGSWLALDYAIRRPARVHRLALTCPPGLSRPLKGYLLKAVLLAPFGRWGKRRTVIGMLGRELSTVDLDAVVEHTVRMSTHYRHRGGELPVFTDDELANLNIPLHVVVGADDVMWDAAITKQRLETHAPRATVHLLPGIGHLVPPQDSELEFLTAEGSRHG
ncbi:alpha/beta hydrolase [Crossiella sp. CA-258035]|uniref:alpha/beta fold hydrolase n=1 Tax=Crossiella sp. CA-258035 TaxID=2981138 RepID=UPI0024BCBD86|nr:alpha/beta hydrolase [Crossiella sp. CA-258035]WHT23061.1 alpha/beta hydrolase [Crossiella sp. CA-258035]